MAKFRAYAIYTASKYMGEFEAEDADSAEDMAWASDQGHVILCHQCAGEVELNGDIDSIQVELADD